MKKVNREDTHTEMREREKGGAGQASVCAVREQGCVRVCKRVLKRKARWTELSHL